MRYFLARGKYLGYSSLEGYALDHSEGDFKVFYLIAEVPESFGRGREGRPLRKEEIEELREICPKAYEKASSERGPLFIVGVPE